MTTMKVQSQVASVCVKAWIPVLDWQMVREAVLIKLWKCAIQLEKWTRLLLVLLQVTWQLKLSREAEVDHAK